MGDMLKITATTPTRIWPSVAILIKRRRTRSPACGSPPRSGRLSHADNCWSGRRDETSAERKKCRHFLQIK
jgi:hypothetical protein